MPVAISSFGSVSKAIQTRTQRRGELRRQIRDADVQQGFPDNVLNSCCNEALGIVQARYPETRIARIAADGGRVYPLPSDAMGVRDVFTQDGSTGTAATRPARLDDRWEVWKGLTTAYAASANQFDSILDLTTALAAPTIIIVYYQPIPPSWGDPADAAQDLLAIDLAPDEGTDAMAALLFYAAARAAAFRWGMMMLPSAGSEDYGREYAAAVQERERLIGLVAGPRETQRFSNGIFR